jgi:hypothetical protein
VPWALFDSVTVPVKRTCSFAAISGAIVMLSHPPVSITVLSSTPPMRTVVKLMPSLNSMGITSEPLARALEKWQSAKSVSDTPVSCGNAKNLKLRGSPVPWSEILNHRP